MHTFLLIIRILMLVGFVAGIVMVMIAGTVADAKKFPKKEMTAHYKTKFQVLGFMVCMISLVVLMILSLFN